jgi:quercetin dioxygenase-like cupin family protein
LPWGRPSTLEPVTEQEQRQWAFAWPEPPDPQITVEHRVAEGNPAAEILRLARALKCDLIVMSTHGRTGLARMLTGSVAEEVLRQAPCPVLLTRPPLAEAPPPEVPAAAGDVVSLRPLGAALASAPTKTLARGDGLEVTRVIVAARQELAEQETTGVTVIQCLEGKVTCTAFGRPQQLEAGDLIYLPAGERHSIKGVKNAALLVTVFSPAG